MADFRSAALFTDQYGHNDAPAAFGTPLVELSAAAVLPNCDRFGRGTALVQQGQFTGQGFIVSSTVEKAIQVASQKYSAEEWSSLQPTLRTEAIYQVLRRLDAERLAASRPRPDTPRRRNRKRRMAPA